MNTTIRNFVIVLAIAALIVLIPGGGTGGTFALQAVSLVFLGVIGWFVYYNYREHRIALFSLGERRRAILYAAAGVVVLTLTATDRLFSSTTGKLAWLLLLIGAAYAAFTVVWSARKY
jgi:phosphoglycerol transferase MdoB-like AlkP superfamily enzyme